MNFRTANSPRLALQDFLPYNYSATTRCGSGPMERTKAKFSCRWITTIPEQIKKRHIRLVSTSLMRNLPSRFSADGPSSQTPEFLST